MGRFDTTKATINANINTNGNQAITGAVMNSVLTQMVDATDAELTELSGQINGAISVPSFSSIAGAYNNDGEIEQTETYSHSSPIFCKKGETIYASARMDMPGMPI